LPLNGNSEQVELVLVLEGVKKLINLVLAENLYFGAAERMLFREQSALAHGVEQRLALRTRAECEIQHHLGVNLAQLLEVLLEEGDGILGLVDKARLVHFGKNGFEVSALCLEVLDDF